MRIRLIALTIAIVSAIAPSAALATVASSDDAGVAPFMARMPLKCC